MPTPHQTRPRTKSDTFAIMNRTGPAAAISLAAGLLAWAGLSAAAGVREVWDEPIYWWLGLPILAVVAGVAGYLAPTKVWR